MGPGQASGHKKRGARTLAAHGISQEETIWMRVMYREETKGLAKKEILQMSHFSPALPAVVPGCCRFAFSCNRALFIVCAKTFLGDLS
jgi:hypothetical protein